jgi:hypothetical protein
MTSISATRKDKRWQLGGRSNVGRLFIYPTAQLLMEQMKKINRLGERDDPVVAVSDRKGTRSLR